MREPRVSWSQNGEDVRLWRVFDAIASGHYVEVGAYEPGIDSVSRSFYERGWAGVAVEPVAEIAERFARERPRDTVVPVAAGAEAGESVLHVIQGTGLSTQSVQQAREHLGRGLQYQERVVEVRPLGDIIRAAEIDPIHFMVIDVEGSEAAVLKGAALDETRPWVVIVEATKPMEWNPTWEEWEPLLLDSGYVLAVDDGLNRFYVAGDRADLVTSLRAPPNPHDGYVPVRHQWAVDRLESLRNEVDDLRRDSAERSDRTHTLERQVESLSSLLAQERSERRDLSQRLEAANDTIAGIVGSRSWRWTAPLRQRRGREQ